MQAGPHRPDATGLWTLRPVEEGDRPFLEALYASTRAREMAAVPWLPEAVRAFLLDQYRLQDHHYRAHYPGAAFELVLLDGVPAGRRYVATWPWEIRLMDLAVLPPCQGRGLGRALMQDLIRISEASDRPLTLHVEHGNPVRAWYERLGFAVKEDLGVYLRMERPSTPERGCTPAKPVLAIRVRKDNTCPISQQALPV